MTWSYRWVAVDRDGEPEIGLYEVYYEHGKPISRTVEPATFSGDTKREAWDAFSRVQIGTEVLDDSVFGERTFSPDELTWMRGYEHGLRVGRQRAEAFGARAADQGEPR